MKRTAIVVLVVAGLIASTGIASARMGGYYGQQDSTWFDQAYQWMGQHMGRYGHMMGYGNIVEYGNAGEFCPGSGAGYYQDTEIESMTLEEATELLEEEIDGTLSSDVYQMGRWYVVFYEDDDEKTKQARIDMFTGEVYTDFYEYMSENSDVYNGRGYRGIGRMMWGY
jgi:hypothetical protein